MSTVPSGFRFATRNSESAVMVGSVEIQQEGLPSNREHSLISPNKKKVLGPIPIRSNKDLTISSRIKGRAVAPDSATCDVGQRFGARLRDLRRGHGMTQLYMAIDFGIDRSYISDIECGKKGVSLATLEVIALGFHLQLSDLLSGV